MKKIWDNADQVKKNGKMLIRGKKRDNADQVKKIWDNADQGKNGTMLIR